MAFTCEQLHWKCSRSPCLTLIQNYPFNIAADLKGANEFEAFSKFIALLGSILFCVSLGVCNHLTIFLWSRFMIQILKITYRINVHVHYLTFPILPKRGHNSDHGWETVVTRVECDLMKSLESKRRIQNIIFTNFHLPFINHLWNRFQIPCSMIKVFLFRSLYSTLRRRFNWHYSLSTQGLYRVN